MIHHSIFNVAAVTSVLMLAGLTSNVVGDESSPWIVRPIATGLTARNVDVMTGPGGEVMVGYADSYQNDVTVARLSSGQKLFDRHTEWNGGSIASFVADQFGNVYYAAQNSSSGMRVGVDLGPFGGLVSTLIRTPA